MSTTYRYVLPVEQTEWKFDGNTETCFTWEYDEPREALLQLYAKGKKQQWDAAERIDLIIDKRLADEKMKATAEENTEML